MGGMFWSHHIAHTFFFWPEKLLSFLCFFLGRYFILAKWYVFSYVFQKTIVPKFSILFWLFFTYYPNEISQVPLQCTAGRSRTLSKIPLFKGLHFPRGSPHWNLLRGSYFHTIRTILSLQAVGWIWFAGHSVPTHMTGLETPYKVFS